MREKFSCRACEAITQPPAPHHAIPRGRAGPGLLAMILNDKFAMYMPLTRQSRAMAAEGIEIDVSTLADGVGAACITLRPLHDAIRTPVLAAERLHGDDTTVPVLARKKTVTGRLWTYVRDVSHANATGPREHGETLRRGGPAGSALLLLPRPGRYPCPRASGRMVGDPAGRCLRRLQRPLCQGPRARADPGGGLLGARATQVLRAGRCRQGVESALGHRSRPPDRPHLQSRARDQRRDRRGSPQTPARRYPSPGRRPGGLDAGRAAQAGARKRRRRRHGRHAQTVADLYSVPCRWTHLSHQQCRRTRDERHRHRTTQLDLRRIR